MDDGATATAGSILERKSMARLVHEVFFSYPGDRFVFAADRLR
ncbi:hypothetical protein ACEK07_16340 [Alcanivoracaceae bacterium MT1]